MILKKKDVLLFAQVPPAKEMTLFLKQHKGVPAIPIVKEVDDVKYGQKIANGQANSKML